MIDPYQLSGKVALVTGASSGLGQHFARLLSSYGVSVIVAARRVERLAELVEEIKGQGGRASATAMDVADSSTIDPALTAGEAALGPIDILINNAGVADSRLFVNVDEVSWDQVIDTNLKGAWSVANAVSRRMLKGNRRGSIVNISSILGLRQGFGESTYAVSKAGVIQLTKSMALELVGKGIRVNALCPGYIRTEINQDFFNSEKGMAYIQQMPAKRLGEMQELDGPLLLLCSESAGSFLTGVALPVDGGHLVSSL